MASATNYFAPVDILDINTLLALEGTAQWLIQTNNKTGSKTVAKGLNGTGDVSATKEHNAMESRTLVYECQAETGSLTLLKAGQVTSAGWHIDSVAVAYQNAGWPQMTVTCHKHAGAASHETGDCRTYTCSLALPAQFGVPSTVTDLTPVTPVTIFTLGSAAVAMRSLSYTLGLTHVDEPGGEGDWHSGENRAGVETLDAQFLGNVDAADLTIGTGWHQPADGDNTSNQGAGTSSLQIQHDLLKDAA